MTRVYSRSTAIARIQYADHPHAYFYVYAPTNAVANLWTVARPIIVFAHPGGWAEHEMDEIGERYPANSLKSSLEATMEKFSNGGAIVVLQEYPLGSGLTRPEDSGPYTSHYPEIWLTHGIAYQVLGDMCLPGGLLDSLGTQPGDPASICAFSFSAGAWNTIFTQWAPESWGCFPRAAGSQIAMGGGFPRSTHYLRAMALQGPGFCPVADDPAATGAGGFSPVMAAVHEPYRYQPKVSILGTMVGTLAAGDLINGSGSTTETATIVSVSGSGAATTIVMLLRNGIAGELGVSETFEKTGATSNTFTGDPAALPTRLDSYGWLQVDQADKEAMSAGLLLDQLTESELNQIKRIPIYAFNSTAPSVDYDPTPHVNGVPRALIAGKYGADDSWDMQFLDYQLNLRGFDRALFQVFYGADTPADVGQAAYDWFRDTIGLRLI